MLTCMSVAAAHTTLPCPHQNGHGRIDSSVPTTYRSLAVCKFQKKSNLWLALLSMTAPGVGLTLTAASNILCVELHWTPSVLAQVEDRCHRIGQANAISMVYCICKDGQCVYDFHMEDTMGE